MATEFLAKSGLKAPHIIIDGDDKSAIEFRTETTDFSLSNTVIDNAKVLDISLAAKEAPSVMMTASAVGSNLATVNGSNIAVLNNTSGKIYYSSNNGSTFSQFNLPTGLGIWGDIEYFNGRYIISGEKAVRTTTDFVTWTAPTFPGLVGTPPAWTLSVANGILFVSFGNNFIYRSSDGITFTGGQRQPTSQYVHFYKIIHDGTRYVGAGNIAAPQTVYTSTDGITWTGQGTAPENYKVLNGISYFKPTKTYYTITENGNTYQTQDLQTWTRVIAIPNGIAVNPFADDTVAMITSNNGMVYYTYDGSTWGTMQLSSSSVFAITPYGQQYLATTGADVRKFALSQSNYSLLQLSKNGVTTGQAQSVLPNSLTRKDYVDDLVKTVSTTALTATSADARYLRLTGGNLTGSLSITTSGSSTLKFVSGGVTNVISSTDTGLAFDVNNDTVAKATTTGLISYKPQSDNVAAFTRKDYVDNKITTASDNLTKELVKYVKVEGSTMTGDLKMDKLSSIKLVSDSTTNFSISQSVDGTGLPNLEFNAGATGATSTIVARTNTSYGTIVTFNGVTVAAGPAYLTVSADSGETWQRNSSADFISTSFSPNMATVANGNFFIGTNTSLYTSPNGTTWTKCNVPADQYFAAGYINGQYFVGTSNGIVKSTNLTTWTKQTITTTPFRHYYAAYSTSSLAIISGIGAVCFTSTDGNTWTARANIRPGTATEVDVLRLDYADEEWFAYSRDRKVYNSSDNGASWKQVSVPTTLAGSNHGLDITSDYMMVGNGPDGTFFTSTDYGQTWKSSKVNDTAHITSVSLLDASNALVFTQSGNIHKVNLGKTGGIPLRVTVDGAFTDVVQSSASNALVRKDYVDALQNNSVKKVGDTMSGSLTISTANDSPLILDNTDDGPFYISYRRNGENRFFLRHVMAPDIANDSLEFVSAARDATSQSYIIPLKATSQGVYSGVPTPNSSIALTRRDYVDGRLNEKVNKAGDTMTGSLTLQYNAPVMTFVETDNANKKWAFAADGGTFRIHEDSTGITDPEVVLMVTLDKKTAIRNPTSRSAQGTTADSLTRKDYVDGKVAKSGDTMTGTLVVNVPNAYTLATGEPSIDLKNGRMVGINQLLFNDESDVVNEGILFPKTGKSGSRIETDYDIIRALDGKLLFNNQEAYGAWNKPTALDVNATDLKYGWGSTQAWSIIDMDSDPKTWNDGKMGVVRAISTTTNKPEGLTGEGILTRYQTEDDATSFKLMFMAGNNTYRRLYVPSTGWGKWTKLAGFVDGIMSMPIGTDRGLEFGTPLSNNEIASNTFGDSASVTYDSNYKTTNTDYLVFTKYDGNDLSPDGGFVFNWKSRTIATQTPPNTNFEGEYLRMNRDTVFIPAMLDVTSKKQTNVQFRNLGDASTSSDTVLRLVQDGKPFRDSAVLRLFIKPTIAEITEPTYHAQFFTGDSSLTGATSIQQVFSVDYAGNVNTMGKYMVNGQEVYHPGNMPTVVDASALKTAGGIMTGAINFALPGTTTSYGSLAALATPNRLQLTSVANVLVQADHDNKNANETLTLAAGLNQLVITSGAAAKTDSIAYNGNKLYHEGNKPTAADVNAVKLDADTLAIDLNTINTSGVYRQIANVAATAANHYPVQLAGTLFVTPSAYGSQQEYTTFTGRKFQRGLTAAWNGSGPWGAWTEFWSEITPDASIPYLKKTGDGALTLSHAYPTINFDETDAVGGTKRYVLVSDGKGIRLQEDNTTTGREIWHYSAAKDSIELYKPSAPTMGTAATSLVTKAYADAIDVKNVAKAGDTMTGTLTLPKIKSALTLLDKASIKFADGSSTWFHLLSEGNTFKLKHGGAGEFDVITVNPDGSSAFKGSLSAPDFIQTTAQTNNAAASTRKDYVDAEIAKCLPKAGGSVTGNIVITNDSSLTWSRNTDSASISFKNDSDADTDSYMHFKTSDNGNEYFRWSAVESTTTHQLMTLKKGVLDVSGKITADVIAQNGVGLDCNILSLNIGGVATNITTAQFIDLLKAQGAFVNRHWIGKTGWSYAANATITDTGVGNLNLTGCVVEVYSQDTTPGAYIIRVTTPTTAPSGTPNSQFTYVNHGPAYAPGWRRDYNTANPPPAGTGSDIKLKKDITQIENALEKVNSLRGVEYNLKKDGSHHCGFIAQEVENVIPEAVHMSDDGQTKLVEYGNMVAYMAEAIKELTAQVKQLQDEMSRLKTQ